MGAAVHLRLAAVVARNIAAPSRYIEVDDHARSPAGENAVHPGDLGIGGRVPVHWVTEVRGPMVGTPVSELHRDVGHIVQVPPTVHVRPVGAVVLVYDLAPALALIAGLVGRRGLSGTRGHGAQDENEQERERARGEQQASAAGYELANGHDDLHSASPLKSLVVDPPSNGGWFALQA